jgi:hypothetical protein
MRTAEVCDCGKAEGTWYLLLGFWNVVSVYPIGFCPFFGLWLNHTRSLTVHHEVRRTGVAPGARALHCRLWRVVSHVEPCGPMWSRGRGLVSVCLSVRPPETLTAFAFSAAQKMSYSSTI